MEHISHSSNTKISGTRNDIKCVSALYSSSWKRAEQQCNYVLFVISLSKTLELIRFEFRPHSMALSKKKMPLFLGICSLNPSHGYNL